MAGKIVATCVERESQQLQLIRDGILTASVGQKRELFTYLGVKALYDYVHSPIKFSLNDAQAGISPIPTNFNTGTFIVTKSNVEYFLQG